MNDTKPFAPFYKVGSGSSGGTLVPSVTVACTAGSATASGQLPAGAGDQVQIANQALTAWAYVNFGIFGKVTAATSASSLPVPPLTARVVTVDPEVTGASIILSAGAANVILTRGNGG